MTYSSDIANPARVCNLASTVEVLMFCRASTRRIVRPSTMHCWDAALTTAPLRPASPVGWSLGCWNAADAADGPARQGRFHDARRASDQDRRARDRHIARTGRHQRVRRPVLSVPWARPGNETAIFLIHETLAKWAIPPGGSCKLWRHLNRS